MENFNVTRSVDWEIGEALKNHTAMIFLIYTHIENPQLACSTYVDPCLPNLSVGPLYACAESRQESSLQDEGLLRGDEEMTLMAN